LFGKIDEPTFAEIAQADDRFLQNLRIARGWGNADQFRGEQAFRFELGTDLRGGPALFDKLFNALQYRHVFFAVLPLLTTAALDLQAEHKLPAAKLVYGQAELGSNVINGQHVG
jgi:hypothetical protein